MRSVGGTVTCGGGPSGCQILTDLLHVGQCYTQFVAGWHSVGGNETFETIDYLYHQREFAKFILLLKSYESKFSANPFLNSRDH